MYFAWLYIQIKKYRMLDTEEQKKAQYPKIHALMTKSWLRGIVLFIGLAIVTADLLCAFTAIKAPYAWTNEQNLMFFGLQRTSYVTGVFMVLFVMFFGGFSVGKAFLSRPFFLVCGKVVFEACLVCPMVIQMIYSTMPQGMFVSFNFVNMLGMGNVATSLSAGIFIYIFIEHPLTRLTQWTVLKFVSHD